MTIFTRANTIDEQKEPEKCLDCQDVLSEKEIKVLPQQFCFSCWNKRNSQAMRDIKYYKIEIE